jgi:two-component system cell cycle response regulator
MDARRESDHSRILIVDDNQDSLEILRARLESWGYRTQTASDGEDALEKIDVSPPDLILLDIMMPRMDGMEVARRVKGNPSLPFIPIIMETALATTESKVEGLDSGADDYITKPIDFAELRARVNSMLRIKRLQAELEDREQELLSANEQLLHMSQTDALTGLDNRRQLERRLDELFAHARRFKEPVACVICDLDRFKTVNDTHGHQAGDEVLKQFAAILRREARSIDRVGRYGGEEFMFLLPGAGMEAAGRFAERVRKQVEANTFTFNGASIRRTASFGVSAWPHPNISAADVLVRTADEALYVAKETGRNRVVQFDGDAFNAHISGDDGRDQPGSDARAARPATHVAPAADAGIRWER